MRKKFSAHLLGALLGAAFASAPASPPAVAADRATTATVSFASQYLFRGVRLGGPSFQPSLEYDAGALALGAWGNVPLADKVAGQSDPEVDFFGAYSVGVVRDTLSLVPGFTIYTFPRADPGAGFHRATVEPNLAADCTLGPVKLTPKIYYDFILRRPTGELTAALAIPLPDAGTELDFTGTYGSFKSDAFAADTTPGIRNWGDYWLVGVTAPFQITRDSKVAVGFAYTKGTNNYLKQGTAGKSPNAAAVGRGVLTVSYAFTF